MGLSQAVRTRNALCELLLHPHTRSFRTRTALGQHSQDSIFEVLETCRLTRTGEGIPNVFGIYLLHGPRKQGSIGRDLIYIGQSRAQQGSWFNRFGIKKRSISHLEAILKCKAAGRCSEPTGGVETTGGDPSTTVQWAHRRFSHTDFEDTRLAVLSVFPYPQSSAFQVLAVYPYLFALAEAIDTILLNSYLPRSGSAEAFELWLRPPHIPQRLFEGVNRELPSRQQLHFYLPVISISWSPEEICAFVNMVRDNEAFVYQYTGKRRV